MLDKDKIIIVVYVGAYNVKQIPSLIENVRNGIISYFDESVKLVFVPTRENYDIKFECINPVLLNEEQYKNVEKKIEQLDKIVEELNKEKDIKNDEK